MNKQELKTKDAPEALGPYSQGVKCDNFIFLSMQIGLDPHTQQMVNGGIEHQTNQIFNNIKAILQEADTDFSKIVRVTVYMKDMAHFKQVNKIYAGYFEKPFPARAAMAVKQLPLDADIAIEVTAYK